MPKNSDHINVASNRINEIIRLSLYIKEGDSRYSDKYIDVPYIEDVVRNKLLPTALIRELNLSDLDRVLVEIDAEKRADWDKYKACRARSDSLHVFFVYNTTKVKLTVLAKDAACARGFALQAGHVHDKRNARVTVLKPEKTLELRQSGSALGRALRDGYPGVVRTLGNNVVMESTESVYTPLTIVPMA